MIINNTYYDGSTVDLYISGVGQVNGIKSIDWGISKEETIVRTTGQKPIGKTPGIISVENVSLEILTNEHFRILKMLGGNYQALLNKVFDITVTYSLPYEPVNSVTLRQCGIVSVSNSHPTGDASELVTTWEMSALGIDDGSANAFMNVDIGYRW